MYKATRQLITARQKHTHYIVEVVKVQSIGGGKENDCFYNATNAIEADRSVKIVGGWLVAPYCKDTNSTEIVSHFWNSKGGRFFDCTPGVKSEYEYVIDMDLVSYGQEHFDKLSNLVCSSLLLRDGAFELVCLSESGAKIIGNVEELKCEVLFSGNTK